MNLLSRWLPALLITLLIAGCKQTTSKADLLPGVWVQANRTHPFIEIWSRANNGTLTGKGGQIRNGDTCYHETLLINPSAISPYYRALLPGRPAVDFHLDKSTNNRWVWSCPENDFPRSISYEFIGKDLLRIILSGDAPSDTLLMERQN